MSLYVFFDTNVIVSAMVSPHPNASTVKALEAISKGKIIPLFNEEIIAEYEDVLHRQRFHLLEKDVANIIGSIIKLGVRVIRTESGEQFPDLSDAKFYESALSKEGAYVVTGNTRHFPKNSIVLTPAELLELLY